MGAEAFYVRGETLTELPESLGALKQLRLLDLNENLLDPELAAAYEPRSFRLGCFALSLDGRRRVCGALGYVVPFCNIKQGNIKQGGIS